MYPSDQKGEDRAAGNLAFLQLEFRIMSSGQWIYFFFNFEFLWPHQEYVKTYSNYIVLFSKQWKDQLHVIRIFFLNLEFD